jgi:4-hydroxy-2-oxoheptanedioate aldolase
MGKAAFKKINIKELNCMRKNLLKEKLLNKQRVIGCNISVCAPSLIEILALSGFDYVFIDCEHASLDGTECEHLIRTAEAANITPILRTPMNAPELMIRYMDSGVQGIVVPGIRTKAEAEKAVQAVRYYPLGMRGLSPGRSSDYGMTMPMSEYCEYANSQMLLLPSMEHIDCVNNLEEILGVDGLDGVLFGTSDLSQSLGHPGQSNHPDVKAAVEKARQICLKSGKPFGSVVRAGEVPEDYYSKGYLSCMTSIPSLLGGAAKQFAKLAKG